jgi:hypothetical protein
MRSFRPSLLQLRADFLDEAKATAHHEQSAPCSMEMCPRSSMRLTAFVVV